jgi:hypothetical protein
MVNSIETFQIIETRTAMGFKNPTGGHISKGNESMYVKEASAMPCSPQHYSQ